MAHSVKLPGSSVLVGSWGSSGSNSMTIARVTPRRPMTHSGHCARAQHFYCKRAQVGFLRDVRCSNSQSTGDLLLSKRRWVFAAALRPPQTMPNFGRLAHEDTFETGLSERERLFEGSKPSLIKQDSTAFCVSACPFHINEPSKNDRSKSACQMIAPFAPIQTTDA
jgi:hypothetical protein